MGWHGVRSFIVKGTTGDHSIFLWRGGAYCSCVGFQFRKRCRHVEEVRKMIELDDLDKVEVVKKYESSVKALNELFGDSFYNSGFIQAIYGEPKVGKTLLLIQDMFCMASRGARVLFLDTEGSLEMLKKWKGVFEGRFGKKGKVFYDKAFTIESLLRKFGIEAEIKRKENKSEFRVRNEEESEIKGVDWVFVDSVSAPFRQLGSNQQDFPVRADAMGALFLGMVRLMDKGVGITVTVHESYNPANPFDKKVKMRGGSVLEYFAKRVVYVDRRDAKGLEDYRRFWLVRSEDDRAWSRAVVAKITELGFVDVDRKEAEKCFTESEKKKVGDGNESD